MINTYHREKLINAIIYFAQNTKYCGKIKLFKLLYFLDFWHFKQTGKSVTGLDSQAAKNKRITIKGMNHRIEKI